MEEKKRKLVEIEENGPKKEKIEGKLRKWGKKGGNWEKVKKMPQNGAK